MVAVADGGTIVIVLLIEMVARIDGVWVEI